MGANSKIEWTDHTWNPWRGCRKVSAGCKHCYMFREQVRYGRDPSVVVRASRSTFFAPKRWTESARVFTCSWSDWFIEQADPWRDDAWEVIRSTPQLTYQILTKRPELIAERLPADWGHGWPNVWLGVSVENQAAADKRIPLLLKIPAKVRFLSCEPLLGPVDFLASVFHATFPGLRLETGIKAATNCGIDWVIAGGESGPKARPMHQDWARSIRDQCQSAGVPFFFKQWGELIVPEQMTDATYRDVDCRVNLAGLEERFYRVGKKAAGRLLDGREWDEWPEPR